MLRLFLIDGSSPMYRAYHAPVRTAEGVVRVVNAAMSRALRVISVERGHDPRDFTLMAFGGAAALHASASCR